MSGGPSRWYEVIRGPRTPSVRWPQAQHLQPPYGQQSERRVKVDFQEGRRGRWRNPAVAQPRIPAQPELVPTRFTPQHVRGHQKKNEKDPLVASLHAELQKARSKVHHGVSRTGTEARIGGKEGVGGCTEGCPGRRGPVGAAPGGGCSGCLPSHSRRVFRERGVGTFAGFGGRIDASQFRGEVHYFVGTQQSCQFRCCRTHECRVGGTQAGARRFASIGAGFAESRQQCQKEAGPHIGCTFTRFGPREPNRCKLIHFNSNGFGKCPRPFIQDGVSDSKRSAPIPVVERIRPPQMSGRQRLSYGLRGVRVGEASHPGPATLQETLVDSLEFDLTRVESGVGTTTTPV